MIGLPLYHTSPAFSQVSVDIPPDDPIYDFVSDAERAGKLTGEVHAFQGITEANLGRLLASDERLAAEMARLGVFPDRYRKNWTRFELRGGLFGTNAESVPFLEIDARVNPLLEPRFGRWTRGGVTGWIEPRFSARWGGWGAADIAVEWPFLWSNEGEGSDIAPNLRSAYLKFGVNAFEAQLGRFPVFWGHGLSGSLLLGRSGTPLTGLQIRNVRPVSLLGPTQVSMLAAVLDGDQHFPHSILVAERFGFRPWKWLELGMGQSIILGGEGSPETSGWCLLSEVFGFRCSEQENYSNRQFVMDGRISFRPFAFYAEIYLEDCCGYPVRDGSVLAGFSFPNLLPSQRLSLTLEAVRTTEITHRNETFQSGYENDHHILGHPLGPDARALYLFSEYRFNDRLRLKGEAAYERRARLERDQQGEDIRNVYPEFQRPEDRYRFTVSPVWYASQEGWKAWVRGSVGYEYVHGYLFQEGSDRHNGLGFIETGLSF